MAFFPSDELLRAEAISSSRELLSQRLYALGQLRSKSPKILICHPSSVLRFLPNPSRFDEMSINFKVGENSDLSKLKSKLVEMGYERCGQVQKTLQFSSRGDILDIYSVSYLNPIRIEFFADTVESIREFDLQSQESKKKLDEAIILPATDIFISEEELISFKKEIDRRLKKETNETCSDVEKLITRINLDLDSFINHDYKPSLYKYYGLAAKYPSSVLDYFEPDLIMIANKERFVQSSNLLRNEAYSYFEEEHAYGRSLNNLPYYLPIDYIIKNRKNLVFFEEFGKSTSNNTFLVHPIKLPGRSMNAFTATLKSYLHENQNVALTYSGKKAYSAITDALKEENIKYEECSNLDFSKEKLTVWDLNLPIGFEIPELKLAVISSSELFGNRSISSRFSSRFKNASILRSYEELKPGDYLVHEYNGIGQFISLKTIEMDGVHRDFLYIAYANNEFLYVPLEQFRLVRKYAGSEGASPKLSRLNGSDWKKKKAHIKERINDLAERLITLYGNRIKIEGHAFPKDDELQEQFEKEFAYELTGDQLRAAQEIKSDMEQPIIMDRLLCGDVGFGKTEVAFRAAFKAICDGKQVAMLCPTTLLTRQHHEVAMSRFEDFGVRIALVSRMISDGEMKKICDGLEKGEIDFVIGTHRLLSEKIHFKDLGLLIVDEEQRFGVLQKERIKEIKQSVDVLTLSATPIPRTLQMSLVGIRPLSLINSPPQDRMPIQTHVTPCKEDVVDELISRELARHGQVFYVHNKISTIHYLATNLAKRNPFASIGVIHGQMDKEEVEEVMEKFYDGKLDVLVSTTIIENGIDIPNANMIIIEDADTFGLSQLYQIKGRVGRGDRIAYAYLMYRQEKNMKDDARKRLRAISEFTELGSGYRIAQRDLMIRGAGDILGPEQAGFIDSIGLDLYLKMLNEAIIEKQTGIETPPPTPHKMFTIDAYIPKEYASDSDKLKLYQDLQEVETSLDVTRFKKKVRDIYGKIPKEFELLIQKKKIDLLVENEEFSSIDEYKEFISIIMGRKFTNIEGIGSDLFNDLAPYLGIIKVSYLNKCLRIDVKKVGNWMNCLETVLKIIHNRYLQGCELEKQLNKRVM